MPTLKRMFVGRMNTKANQLVKPEGDLDLVINAEAEKKGSLRKVKGYEQIGDTLSAITSQIFDTSTEWEGGTLASTTVLGNSLILKGGVIQQTEQDDSYQIHGDNWFAQSFKATATSISKVSLLIDKVLGASLSLYDNFNDNSIDSTKWATTGSVSESSGRLIVSGTAGTFSTDNKTAASPPGEPILGAQWYQEQSSGTDGAGGVMRTRLTDGTNYIEVAQLIDVHDMIIRFGGTYGSGDGFRWHSTNSTIEIKQDGSDIKIYTNGVLRHTLSGRSIQSNSYFEGTLSTSNTHEFIIDNVYFYTAVTDLTDLDIRIETDSSGPSGSLVTNGSVTIDDANVSTSPEFEEATFATPPALTVDTTYWLVAKQTGGDSSNYYRIYKKNSDVYTNGQVYTSSNGGVAWAVDTDGSTDAAFKVYGTYPSSGTWISSNIILATGQTLTQLVITANDLSGTSYISRVDIVDTSDVIQSSYTTPIISGTTITLTSSNLSFAYTSGNTFRVKLTLASSGVVTPVVNSLSIDSPTRTIKMLKPFYQSSGTKKLIAAVAGTLKILATDQWNTLKSGLTSGLDTDATIFRASKNIIQKTGTATGGASTSLTDTAYNPAPNVHQGQFIKIVRGQGAGQVRVIKNNTGTSTSTSTTTSTTSSTTTSTSTTTT